MVRHLGKRFSSDVANGKCALSEGSTTKCGHFPHHVPLGTVSVPGVTVPGQETGRRENK